LRGKKKILIIDDEQSLLESLEMYLTELGYRVDCATSAGEGLQKKKLFEPHVVILDIRLPDRDGLDILRELRDESDATPVIMITAFHDMDTTIRTVKLGAFEYIPKPIDVDELRKAVERAIRFASPPDEKDAISPDTATAYEARNIIGKSRVMKEVFKAVGRLSENLVTVLIEGATGTGKELIARAIHNHGPFRDEPFIAVNCSNIVGTLLESDLFGHEKGAFTGATKTKRGKFELAGRGTILLDEVAEIPLDLQAKLLRVLQEKEFERVGGEKTIRSHARVLAATNRDLWGLVQGGGFRNDLFYRLSVATIRVPVLRERRSDIPLLTAYLLKKISHELKIPARRVEKRAGERLMAYDWPGNVRELENVLTRAALDTQGELILEETIASLIGSAPARGGEAAPAFRGPSLQEVEKEYILKVLSDTRWHFGKACTLLGVSRPTLRAKLKVYGISPDKVKTA
jgi:two-component system, NtrC family, response regulator AtoC